MINDTRVLAQHILEQTKYLTLATSTTDGHPWVSPLYFSFDSNLSFYWASSKDAKHSQLLQNNAHVSAVIFNEHTDELQWDALYFIGSACEVSEQDFPSALKTYLSRGIPPFRGEHTGKFFATDFLGDSPMRLYTLTTEEAYILHKPEVINGHITINRQKMDFKL